MHNNLFSNYYINVASFTAQHVGRENNNFSLVFLNITFFWEMNLYPYRVIKQDAVVSRFSGIWFKNMFNIIVRFSRILPFSVKATTVCYLTVGSYLNCIDRLFLIVCMVQRRRFIQWKKQRTTFYSSQLAPQWRELWEDELTSLQVNWCLVCRHEKFQLEKGNVAFVRPSEQDLS